VEFEFRGSPEVMINDFGTAFFIFVRGGKIVEEIEQFECGRYCGRERG
jgi:hypothetical protein